MNQPFSLEEIELGRLACELLPRMGREYTSLGTRAYFDTVVRRTGSLTIHAMNTVRSRSGDTIETRIAKEQPDLLPGLHAISGFHRDRFEEFAGKLRACPQGQENIHEYISNIRETGVMDAHNFSQGKPLSHFLVSQYRREHIANRYYILDLLHNMMNMRGQCDLDINMLDDDGQHILDMFTPEDFAQHESIIRFLKESGADWSYAQTWIINQDGYLVKKPSPTRGALGEYERQAIMERQRDTHQAFLAIV